MCVGEVSIGEPASSMVRSLGVVVVGLLVGVSLSVVAPAQSGAQDVGCVPKWQLAFEDDFAGVAVDESDWNLYDSPGHAGNGLRRPSAFSVADGLLTITAANDESGQVVSGGMSNTTSRTYGRYEARVRTDADPTLTMSGVVLTWPIDQGGVDGGYTEINMYETGWSKRTPLDFWVHYDVPNKPDRPNFTAPIDATQWHDVAMEWTESEVAFYIDGSFVGRTERPETIPRADHRMTVQLDAFGDSIEGPVQMEVDWVRIYDYNAAGTADCVADVPGAATPVEVSHTVTCLAGNGRVDTNIVNIGTSAADYRIEFEGLSPRQSTVEAKDWWRMPITGRADGSYEVVVKRSGVIVSAQHVAVHCDGEQQLVRRDEFQVVNGCRSGNGYVLFQFANATAATKAYVIEFAGVNNRSTSAAAFGGTVRAVTGRADGTYSVKIRSGLETIARFSVVVDCS